MLAPPAALDERVGALLVTGSPGLRGGRAIAEALFGEFAPSGRLPYSIYGAADAVTDGGMRPRPGAGHAGPLTHPEAIAEALTEFFASAQQPA